jgi:hypothetical protein
MTRSAARRALFPLLAATALTSCSSGPTFVADVPLVGAWGGRSIALTLSTSGGTVEYDCAHGRIDEALRPDAGGTLRATGVHVREHGGPTRDGEVEVALPAVYVGTVDGDLVTLRVLVGSDTLGPFSARRGSTPQLFKCL